MVSDAAYGACVSSGWDCGGGVEGICHVSFWSFKREFLISSGLTWLMFIVAVVMISRLPHRTQQNCPLGLTVWSLLNYAVS